MIAFLITLGVILIDQKNMVEARNNYSAAAKEIRTIFENQKEFVKTQNPIDSSYNKMDGMFIFQPHINSTESDPIFAVYATSEGIRLATTMVNSMHQWRIHTQLTNEGSDPMVYQSPKGTYYLLFMQSKGKNDESLVITIFDDFDSMKKNKSSVTKQFKKSENNHYGIWPSSTPRIVEEHKQSKENGEQSVNLTIEFPYTTAEEKHLLGLGQIIDLSIITWLETDNSIMRQIINEQGFSSEFLKQTEVRWQAKSLRLIQLSKEVAMVGSKGRDPKKKTYIDNEDGKAT